MLVFNELQYHPPDETTQTEWVELRSLHGVNVDISGWRIEGGIDFTFPAGTIVNGGGYVVVAAAPGQIPGALGPWIGKLDNGGETLRLVNRNGRVMDALSYSDAGDWPPAPDGTGPTLARRNPSAASGPSAWTASTQAGGTPGEQNFYEGAVSTRTIVAAIGDTWKYEDSGNAVPAGWQLVGFNDTSWKSGATLIAGGEENSAAALGRVLFQMACWLTGLSMRRAARWRQTAWSARRADPW